MRPLPPFLLALLLAGCQLIGRRDFWPHADTKPAFPVAVVPPKPGPPPLITIRYDVPHPDYAQAVTDATHRALAAKPDVLFVVLAVAPPAGGPAAQEAALARATNDGREVAQTIIDAGADQGQVELAARADPGVKQEEVRVGVQ